MKLDVDKIFEAHELNDDQARAVLQLRRYARVFADAIQTYTPEGPNQTLAVRHVEDALMRANKALAEGA